MRPLIIIILCAFLGLLSAQTFDESLLKVSEELAAKLKTPKSDCIAIIWIQTKSAQNTDALSYPVMEDYAIQQLYSNFTIKLKLNAIEPAVTKQIVKDKFKGFPLPSTYVKFQSLCEQLYFASSQTPNVIISGSINPERDELLLNFTMSDPGTASIISTISKRIPADAISDGLMGIVRKKAEVQKQEQPVEVVKAEVPKPIGSDMVKGEIHVIGALWSEDFSSYADGDALLSWGKDAVVVPGPEGKKYLSSEKKGTNIARKKMDLPRNFVLRFSFVGYNFESDLIFADADAREYKISFKNVWNGCWINLPDNKGTNVPSRPINAVRIEKLDQAIKLFINGEFTQAGVTDRLDEITSFALYFPESVKFTDFSITKK